MVFFLEQPCVTECRVLIALGTESGLREALEQLLSLRQATSHLHYDCQTIDIISLQSLALHKLRRQDEALKNLEEVLALTGPGGWLRPFVELGAPMVDLLRRLQERQAHAPEVDRILKAFPKMLEASTGGFFPPTLSDRALLKSLTNREIDTLELLAKRLYDKEIAEALSVSVWTVKTHLKNIFQKLQVIYRRQAVLKAKEIGLLKGD